MGRPSNKNLKNWQPSGRIPNDYFSIAGRHAVLIPLTGKLKDWKTDTAEHTHKLTAMWRARLYLLNENYLEAYTYRRESTKEFDETYHRDPQIRDTKRFWRMMNCRPEFFVPTQLGRICNVRNLCPHCWARNVGETWKKVDSLLFPDLTPWQPKDVVVAPSTSHPHAVQSRGLESEDEDDGPQAPRLHGMSVLVVNIPLKVWRGPRRDIGSELDALTEIIQRRTGMRNLRLPRADMLHGRNVDHRKLLEVGCAGGLETLGFDTFPLERDPGDWAWRVTIRQLLVVPTASVDKVVAASAGVLPLEVRETATIKVHEEPTRRKLVYLVAKVMKYDRLLMTGDPERALLALRARGGHRLTTTFGKLYRGAQR